MGLRDIAMRKFRTEDANAVARIMKGNMSETGNADFITPKYVLALSNKRKMYVALDDGKVVGTASIDFDTISDVFIDLEYQNKRIDKALISQLEEISANNGFMLVRLYVQADKQSNYEKLGYIKIEEQISEEFGKQAVMERALV